jgi:hypothetical protein
VGFLEVCSVRFTEDELPHRGALGVQFWTQVGTKLHWIGQNPADFGINGVKKLANMAHVAF